MLFFAGDEISEFLVFLQLRCVSKPFPNGVQDQNKLVLQTHQDVMGSLFFKKLAGQYSSAWPTQNFICCLVLLLSTIIKGSMANNTAAEK